MIGRSLLSWVESLILGAAVGIGFEEIWQATGYLIAGFLGAAGGAIFRGLIKIWQDAREKGKI